MDYQVQLLRGKYRLLARERGNAVTEVKIHFSDFDSVAQLIGGADVSVSLPSVFMCPMH